VGFPSQGPSTAVPADSHDPSPPVGKDSPGGEYDDLPRWGGAPPVGSELSPLAGRNLSFLEDSPLVEDPPLGGYDSP